MSLLNIRPVVFDIPLQEKENPELMREFFPYTKVCRTIFDDVLLVPRPADPMFITDTTFRDGQQARPPYSVKQITEIFELLHRLGGRTGLIRASEFFMYSKKDRDAIEACRAFDFEYPRITGWIRATKNDLKLARDMEFKEVGMLTSVSDYHIYLKLGWNRQQAFDQYVGMARQALEWGIVPRCHFEDITRADIFGFCVPLAKALMDLSKESKMPVKIRLCDTMGYGVPYPGAALPRSVQKVVRSFTDEGGVPGEWLEWHGHNDFHKVLINASTAWLNGCSGVSTTLLGFGERTGNTPLEGMVVEYLSLTGDDSAADTTVIGEIADYFAEELKFPIPHNYPFVGRDFNATSAGIHVDGIAKNEEIYNIFDTKRLLGRPVPIIITDKSGRAGVAFWINNNLKLKGDKEISKGHPAVGEIYKAILREYEGGRTTSFSNEEMTFLAKRYMPELYPSELQRMRAVAGKLSASIISKLAQDCRIVGTGAEHYPWMEESLRSYPFIQYMSLVDTTGKLLASAVLDLKYKAKYESLPLGFDFSEREWFQVPVETGKLHIMDIYQSHFTDKLIISVSVPVFDDKDDIAGILAIDMQFEELLRRADILEEDVEKTV